MIKRWLLRKPSGHLEGCHNLRQRLPLPSFSDWYSGIFKYTEVKLKIQRNEYSELSPSPKTQIQDQKRRGRIFSSPNNSPLSCVKKKSWGGEGVKRGPAPTSLQARMQCWLTLRTQRPAGHHWGEKVWNSTIFTGKTGSFHISDSIHSP